MAQKEDPKVQAAAVEKAPLERAPDDLPLNKAPDVPPHVGNDAPFFDAAHLQALPKTLQPCDYHHEACGTDARMDNRTYDGS